MTTPAHRASAHLLAAGQLYPRAWSDMDHMRRELRGRTAPDWPEWCYMPIAGAQAAVANDADIEVAALGSLYPERVADAARLAGLAAWRMTQGIYRYDPAVYDAVLATPVGGDIPHQVLYRLPEWCVYVETPGLTLGASAMAGAYAHLEHDVNTGRAELRLLLDTDRAGEAALMPLALHLGPWSLAESISRMLDTASAASLARGGQAVPREGATPLRQAIEPLISLLLYICASAADITGRHGAPGNPQPVRTRRDGERFFPASGPRAWDVGLRMGAALRRAYAASETAPAGEAGAHAGPRPHIRRAHWHTYLSGPRVREGAPVPSAERTADLRWLPPIAVGLDDPGDLPAVVRPVK